MSCNIPVDGKHTSDYMKDHTAKVLCITEIINHVFMSFFAVQICDLSYIHLYSSTFTELTTRPAPIWPDSSVGRALHQCHRGHGFKSRSGLNFFQT